MATKICNFDFFTIACQDKSAIEKSFKIESQIRNSGRVNNIKFPDFYARIRHIEQEGKFWFGYVEKVNVFDEAHVGDLSGIRQTLATKPDEGPVFDTVFLYNPVTNVLVLHRNRSGLGTTTFARYLGKLVGEDDLELEIVIDPDTLARLKKINIVRSIDYRISKPQNFTFAKGVNGSMNADLELVKFFKGDNIKVTIGGEGLGKQNIVKKVQSLLKVSDGVSKLEVKGEHNGDPDTIDLIKNRIVHTKVYSLSKNRKLTEIMLMDEIKIGYKKHKTNLDRLYFNKKIDED